MHICPSTCFCAENVPSAQAVSVSVPVYKKARIPCISKRIGECSVNEASAKTSVSPFASTAMLF